MRTRRTQHQVSHSDTQTIGMLDVMALLAAVGILIAVHAVPFINEPPKDVAERRTPTEPIAFYVELRWTDGAPHDIDTWVQCTVPRLDGGKSSYTVNYRQRHAGFLDLVWDDLGGPSRANFERVVSNSSINKIPPNTRCRINAHLYSSHGGGLPIEGALTIVLEKDSPAEIALTPVGGLRFEIRSRGDEISLISLSWDDKGRPMPKATETYPKIPLVCLATNICNDKRKREV